MGIHPESGIFSSDESFNVTRVYRAEIPPLPLQHKQQQQQNTHLPPRPRTSAASAASAAAVATNNKPESLVNLSKSDILLGAILRTCERNRHLEDHSQKGQISKCLQGRRRAESENNQHSHHDLLDPLDLSFDTTKDWSEDEVIVLTEKKENIYWLC